MSFLGVCWGRCMRLYEHFVAMGFGESAVKVLILLASGLIWRVSYQAMLWEKIKHQS